MGIESPTIGDVGQAVVQIRQAKLPDPALLGNAGSFFKNPEIATSQYEQLKTLFPDIPAYPLSAHQVKIPAGWLIQSCGWKGKRIGDAGCHQNQALVLVNYGNATGDDILRLANLIIGSVSDKFGILLSPEVNVV